MPGRIIALQTGFFQSNGQTHPAVLGFIVLSGYCIHRSGIGDGAAAFSHYAARRFFRIVPVFVLASLTGMALFLLSSHVDSVLAKSLSGTNQISRGCIAVKLATVSAWLPSLHACSFEGNAPLTTVIVEIWLYVVYAAAMFFLTGRGHKIKFWLSLTTIWLCGLIWVAFHPEQLGWWYNGSLIGFLVYWWIGAFFAMHDKQGRVRLLVFPACIAWAIATLVLLAKIIATPAIIFAVAELQQLALAILFAQLIVMIDRSRWRLWRYGAPLGEAGYSIYAFHAPLLMMMMILHVAWWAAAVATIGLSLAIFHVYEKPLTRFGKRKGYHAVMETRDLVRDS